MWFDIVCIAIIIGGFAFGYKKGFFAQVGRVLGFLAAVIFCTAFASPLARLMAGGDNDFSTVILTTILAYIIIFAICIYVGRLVGGTLAKGARAIKMGVVNRLGGAIFKTLEYFLYFSILINAWTAIFPSTNPTSNFTPLKKFVINFAPTVLGSPTVEHLWNQTMHTVNNNSSTDDTKNTHPENEQR